MSSKLRNLMAEMVRSGLTNADLQSVIDCKSEKTIRNKLDGTTSFTVPEAVKIQTALFPGLRLEYLFREAGADPHDKQVG